MVVWSSTISAGPGIEAPVYVRSDLEPGNTVAGPALIVEDQTTTVVSSAFEAGVNSLGYLILQRR